MGTQALMDVHSAYEAAQRARAHGYRLMLPPMAYEEMVAAGVAPKDRPADLRDLPPPD